jgi:hypothetical protein
MDCFEGLYQRFAEAVDVWDGGIFANPDAIVENAADVFGKMTVDERIDDADGKRIDQIEFFHGGIFLYTLICFVKTTV